MLTLCEYIKCIYIMIICLNSTVMSSLKPKRNTFLNGKKGCIKCLNTCTDESKVQFSSAPRGGASGFHPRSDTFGCLMTVTTTRADPADDSCSCKFSNDVFS